MDDCLHDLDPEVLQQHLFHLHALLKQLACVILHQFHERRSGKDELQFVHYGITVGPKEF